MAGHRLKHELDLPLVCTFHTLARVKAEGGDAESAWRELAEMEIIGCADAICVSCTEEERQFRRHYGDPPGRVEIVAPGVDHAFFAPGDRMGARGALGLGLGAEPMLLFVGRIQPLKGVDVAVRALAALDRPDASARRRRRRQRAGRRRRGREGRRAGRRARARPTGSASSPPQPHHLLSSYYRAADVVLVPSRSESFGLVALEAAACGTPGRGRRPSAACSRWSTTATPASSSPGRDPEVFASYTDEILGNDRLAARDGPWPRRSARSGYTWSLAAARAAPASTPT